VPGDARTHEWLAYQANRHPRRDVTRWLASHAVGDNGEPARKDAEAILVLGPQHAFVGRACTREAVLEQDLRRP
jgi:hypothetical protein